MRDEPTARLFFRRQSAVTCSSFRRRMMTKAMMDDPRRIREENPFESMMERFDRAAQLLNLNPDLYAVMRVPNRELKVYIPTRMDSGRIQVFEGFRVQHNFARGPAKGDRKSVV